MLKNMKKDSWINKGMSVLSNSKKTMSLIKQPVQRLNDRLEQLMGMGASKVTKNSVKYEVHDDDIDVNYHDYKSSVKNNDSVLQIEKTNSVVVQSVSENEILDYLAKDKESFMDLQNSNLYTRSDGVEYVI